MPAQIEVALFCAQYYSNWEVEGSNGSKYTVTLNGGEGAPFCSCPSFKFSGEYGNQTCKHVDAIWAHGCLYNPQWHDGGPNDWQRVNHARSDKDGTVDLVEDKRVVSIKLISTDTAMAVRGAQCPKCGGPVIPVRIAV